MGCDALAAALKKHAIVSPEPGGGVLTEPFPFNLMFRTSIGPKGDTVGFLRPETAQGIFVSFRDLLYYNGGRLPMAVSQIGQSFRNEISPQQGLLRVREFTQAEIEHFVHPDRKGHPRFAEVAHVAPIMASVAVQQEARRPAPMRLGDAVANGVVANETLAYYIGRTYLFMVAIGINPKRMKFRQHLPNEMAHYACGAASSLHCFCGLKSSQSHLGAAKPCLASEASAQACRLLGLRGGYKLRVDRVRGPRGPLCVRPLQPHRGQQGESCGMGAV